MKVLLIGLANDRTDNYVARGLHAAGVELHVVCTQDSLGHSFCQEEGVPHRVYGFASRIDRTAIGMLRSMVKEHGYDIVHAYTNRALSNVLFATRRLRVRHVGYRGTMGHLSRFDPAAWMTYFNRRVDRVICVSGAVENYLHRHGVAAERLTTIHKGHDPAWYQRQDPVSLTPFGVPDDAFVVGFVGNMRPVKGADVLLEAMGHLSSDSRVHALLVGEVRDRRVARLAACPDVAPRVHLAGFRSDAPALAGACKAIVMPSIDREGLPRVLLEAMSQSVPALVTDVGGMPELVQHDVSGLIVPPRDARSLAAALNRLSSDPEAVNRMGRAARERIEGPFHVRHTLKKTLDLYKDLQGQ